MTNQHKAPSLEDVIEEVLRVLDLDRLKASEIEAQRVAEHQALVQRVAALEARRLWFLPKFFARNG